MLKILNALKEAPDPILHALEGHEMERAHVKDSLIGLVKRGNYHLILAEGVADLLPDIKAADPRAEVVLVGSREEDGVEAIRNGAFAFLTEPIDAEHFAGIIGEINEMCAVRREMAHLEEQLDQKYAFSGIVGRNPKILDIISLIKRVAPYYKTVT